MWYSHIFQRMHFYGNEKHRITRCCEENVAMNMALQKLLVVPFVLKNHSFDCNEKAPAELIEMGAGAAMEQVRAIAREALGGGKP